MANWDFDRDGVYIFNFSPSRDDFSQVKVGAAWNLTPAHALAGNENAIVLSSAGAQIAAATDAHWLFSAPFDLKAGELYEAALKYKGANLTAGPAPTLTLRIGQGQDPTVQTLRLMEFSISNSDVDVVHTTFQVPQDGTYHFSLQGSPTPAEAILVANAAGKANALTAF